MWFTHAACDWSKQEIRRLEREVKEKQTHIADLGRQATYMRKRTLSKQNRKQLEQLQQSIDARRLQSRDIHASLERHIVSADQRLHALLNLLPELEAESAASGSSNHNDFLLLPRADTDDMTSSDVESSHGGSRLGTPLSSSAVARPHSAIFNKHTYKKLAETLGKRDAIGSAAAQPHKTPPNANIDATTPDSDDMKHNMQSDTSKIESGKRGAKSTGVASAAKTHTSDSHRRTLQTSKPTLTRNRAKDASPATNRNRPSEKKQFTASSSLDIDRWVEQEQANERKRNNAQKPLTLAKVQVLAASGDSSPPTTNTTTTTNNKLPNMLPIKESQTERDTTATTSNMTSPNPTAPNTSRQPHHQQRLSVDYNGTKLGSKEHYHKNKQRNSLTDFEHEKGYWETKNSSASSGSGNRASDLERETNAHIDVLSNANKRSSDTTAQRNGLLSVSRTNCETSDTGDGGSGGGQLSHRKRRPSLLSLTDSNANINFVEEKTSELSHFGRGYNAKQATSPYKELNLRGEKLKPTVPHSREVLKFNRIDLIGCLPGD